MYKRFKNWCNANQGLLTMVAIVVAITGLVPFNSLDLGFTNSLLEKIKAVGFYNIKIPVYIFLIILLIGLFYFKTIKNRYLHRKITIDFLKGIWKNEWTLNGQSDSEICEIKDDGKYYVNEEHWFTLENFKYDYKTNKITFFKTSVRPGDNRKMLNMLTIENNDLISGNENNYDIRYRRI
jgi:hypothetical protein